MTGREVVNLIHILREKGIDSNEILEIIEYIETYEPREDNSSMRVKIVNRKPLQIVRSPVFCYIFSLFLLYVSIIILCT